MPQWHSPSNWDEIDSDCPAWGLSPTGSHGSATTAVGSVATCSFQTRNNRQLSQEALYFRTPDLALLSVRSPASTDRSFQPENQITGSQVLRHQAKSFTPLPFDCITKRSVSRQPLRYDPSEPSYSFRRFPTEVQIKTLTPDNSPRFHNDRKLSRPVQTLSKTKRGFVFRLRDDDDPWHDAHGSQHDHRGYACARGSRGCACGAQPMADRCVSWQNPLFKKSGGLQPFAVILSSETASLPCG